VVDLLSSSSVDICDVNPIEPIDASKSALLESNNEIPGIIDYSGSISATYSGGISASDSGAFGATL